MARERAWADEYTLLCERCGYVVEGLDPSGNCPECGKPIAESLPERRVGTPWQQGRISVRNYFRTARVVLLSPRQALNTLSFGPHLSAASFAHTSFVLSSLSLVSLLVYTAALVETATAIELMTLTLLASVGSSLMFFGVWALLAVLTWVEARGLVFFAARRGLRVTPDMARAICAHGAIGWPVGGIGLTAVLVLLDTFGNSVPASWHPHVLWIPVLPPLAGFLFFEIFAWLGLRRCKFANRVRPAISGEHESDSPP